MGLHMLMEGGWPQDPFDPNTWGPEPAPDTPFYLCLSDRTDVHAILDYQDYLWARELSWCHTYGSGKMVEVAEDVFCIERPENVYARRCLSGGGVIWLHREVLFKMTGRRPKNLIGDHKNGITLDCRRVNLRWATRSQNSKNIAGSKTRQRLLQKEARL